MGNPLSDVTNFISSQAEYAATSVNKVVDSVEDAIESVKKTVKLVATENAYIKILNGKVNFNSLQGMLTVLCSANPSLSIYTPELVKKDDNIYYAFCAALVVVSKLAGSTLTPLQASFIADIYSGRLRTSPDYLKKHSDSRNTLASNIYKFIEDSYPALKLATPSIKKQCKEVIKNGVNAYANLGVQFDIDNTGKVIKIETMKSRDVEKILIDKARQIALAKARQKAEAKATAEYLAEQEAKKQAVKLASQTLNQIQRESGGRPQVLMFEDAKQPVTSLPITENLTEKDEDEIKTEHKRNNIILASSGLASIIILYIIYRTK